MVKVNMLRGLIKDRGMSALDLAEPLGVKSEQAVYKKIRNAEKMSIKDAMAIGDALGLTATEMCNIFFSS